MEEKVLQRGGELDMVTKRDDAGRETVAREMGKQKMRKLNYYFVMCVGCFV